MTTAWRASRLWRAVVALVVAVLSCCLYWRGGGNVLLWLAALGVASTAVGLVVSSRSGLAARVTGLALGCFVVGVLWLVYGGPFPLALWLLVTASAAAAAAVSIGTRARLPFATSLVLVLLSLYGTFAAIVAGLDDWTF